MVLRTSADVSLEMLTTANRVVHVKAVTLVAVHSHVTWVAGVETITAVLHLQEDHVRPETLEAVECLQVMTAMNVRELVSVREQFATAVNVAVSVAMALGK